MNNSYDLPLVVTAKRAAEYTGVPYTRILAMCKDGTLQSIKHGERFFVNTAILKRTFLIEEIQ